MQIVQSIFIPGLFFTYTSYKQKKSVNTTNDSPSSGRTYSSFSSSSSSSSPSSSSSSSSSNSSSSGRTYSSFSSSPSSSSSSTSSSNSSSSSSSSGRTYSSFSSSNSSSPSSTSSSPSSSSSGKSYSRHSSSQDNSSSQQKSSYSYEPSQSSSSQQNRSYSAFSSSKSSSDLNNSSNGGNGISWSSSSSLNSSPQYENKKNNSNQNTNNNTYINNNQNNYYNDHSNYNQNSNRSFRSSNESLQNDLDLNQDQDYKVMRELLLLGALGAATFFLAINPMMKFNRNKYPFLNALAFKDPKKLLQETLKSTSSHFDSAKFNPNLENCLVYGQGPVNLQLWQNKLLTDRRFGVIASSPHVLAFQRAVNVFQKENQNSGWIFAHQFQQLYPNLYHPCMQEVFIIPERIKLGQYEIPYSETQHILKNLQESTFKIQIDSKLADNNYQLLIDKFQSYKAKKPQLESTFIHINQIGEDSHEDQLKNYLNHPYTYAIENKKQIIFENDCIYIVNDINNLQNGDICIHWNEIKPILEASIIAEQQGKYLGKHNPQYLKDYEIICKVRHGDQYNQIKLDGINILKEGRVEKEVMINEFMNSIIDYSTKQSQDKNYDGYTRKYEIGFAQVLAAFIFFIYMDLVNVLEVSETLNPILLACGHLASIYISNSGIMKRTTLIKLLTAQYCIIKFISLSKNSNQTKQTITNGVQQKEQEQITPNQQNKKEDQYKITEGEQKFISLVEEGLK